MASCKSCGKSLSLVERMGEDICRECARQRKQDRQDENAEWARLHSRLSSSRVESRAIDEAVELKSRSHLSPDELQERSAEAVRAFARGRIRDDMLSRLDEGLIGNLAQRMGFAGPWEKWLGASNPLSALLAIAAVNSGRLPVASAGDYLMNASPDEVLHYRVSNAALLAVGRKYVRTYQGVSLPVGKTRVRYHFGTSSGRVVATGFEPVDSGTFLITSHRALFMGQANTKAVYYGRLLDIRVFVDGLEFFLDNRVKPIILKLGSPTAEIAGAIVQVAARRSLGTWSSPVGEETRTGGTTEMSDSPRAGVPELDALASEIDKRLEGGEASDD